MGKHITTASKRGVKTKVLASLAVVALAGIGGVGATMSALTDAATTTVTVDAGTINLQANSGGTDSKATNLDFGIPKWYPGATATKTITLKNTGTLPLNVSLTTAASGGTTGLGSKLTSVISNTTVTPATVLSAAGPIKDDKFSNVRINPNASVTLSVKADWISVNNNDDNTWSGKADTITYTFNAVSVAP